MPRRTAAWTPTVDAIIEAKRALRRRMRALRGAVPDSDRLRAAERLADVLGGMDCLAGIDLLVGTFPAGAEVDAGLFCTRWLQSGRCLALPRVDEASGQLVLLTLPDTAAIRPGYRGCPEPDPARGRPVTPAEVGALLVPGLAFDPRGGRLGQGGGHYDGLLRRLSAGAVVIGVAFPFQVVERVPSLAGVDQPVRWVATPEGALECRR
jgi:5-formyltetrahydrofolate cyclo-ligase